MKCPYCGYEHGFIPEKMERVEGKQGDFFKLPNTLYRRNNWGDVVEEARLYSCPDCYKTFTEVC